MVRRFDENPLIRPADVPASRPDYEVVGAFNPGAIVHGGETLLLLRVAERPRTSEDEHFAPIFNPETMEVNTSASRTVIRHITEYPGFAVVLLR